MLSQPRPSRLDLLLVGGMTVDRMADGSVVAGGSVLHAAPAAAASDGRVAAVTLAGPEPEVEAGLRRLRGILRHVEVRSAERSIGFEHGDHGGRRVMRFLGSSGTHIRLDEVPDAAAILYAPVADELDAAGLAGAGGRPVRAASLQGWLRHLVPGELVSGRPLTELDPGLVAALSRMDLLMASREDLLAEGDRPDRQLDALRSALGPRPVLVLTDAAAGAWIDRAGAGTSQRWHLPVQRLVEGVPTVGAGDLFAAALTLRWPRDRTAERDRIKLAAQDAMGTVAEELERRR